MAHLEDATVGFGGRHEAVGFGEGGGDGFFDENVNAGFEQRAADFGVRDGGDGYDCGVCFADDVTVVCRSFGSAGFGVFAGSFPVCVYYEGENCLRIL
jgi:hypothetical protein